MRFFLLGWIVRVKVWFTILIVAVIVTIREFDIILSLTECTEDTEFYYLSPTDNTDFFALLKILATFGNLSKLNCPRLSQDFSDFLPFFHLRFKDRWFGFNNSLFDYVKLLPWVVIIAPFGIV